MSFFVSLWIIFSSMSSQVLWNHEEIIIPLHGDFLSELYELEANLYIDGVIIEDARVIYKYDGVERTFLSTINTSIVKTYTHKIEAYFPDYNMRHVMTVSIKIIDHIPPEILSVPLIKVRIGDKMPNLLIGFSTIDNYDSKELLDIEIDTSQVIDTQIGSYPITYYVYDLSGNESKKTTQVEFFDDIPPQITSIKPLRLNIDDEFKWDDYFSIVDNYDLFPMVTIDSVITKERLLGTYNLFLKAIDQSGNISSIETKIEVFDDTAPTLYLSNERPDIPYQTEDIASILKKLILKVEDNYDDLSIDDVIIISSINPDVIGSYLVTFKIKDQSNNETKLDLYLKVKDQNKPTVEIIKPLIFNVFDPIPLFEDYIDYQDNLSHKEDIIFEVIGSFFMNKKGKYPITIKVTDEAKNQLLFNTYLEVKDHTYPEISLIKDIMITKFKPIDYRPYFQLHDEYDDILDIDFMTDDSMVNYEEVGIYTLIVTAIDPAQHETSMIVDVIIMDIESPELVLKTEGRIDYPYQGNPIDYRSYITSVHDNHDELKIEDVQISGEVNTRAFGLYQIKYTLEDFSGNKTQKILEFLIVDHESPIIIFDDLTINQYEDLDFLKGVEMMDQSHDVKISYFPKSVDTSTPGSVIITYVAIDSRGNYMIKDRLVIIQEVEQKIPIQQYFPLISIVIMGLSSVIFLYFKDVKHMF